MKESKINWSLCSAALHLQTFRHDVAQIFECNLLGDILCLDVFVLFCDQNRFALVFPAILFHPVVECVAWNRKRKKNIRFRVLIFLFSFKIPTIDVSEQSLQVIGRDGLECDVDDIANEFPDGIEETVDVNDQVGCRQNLWPEQLEVAFLQDVGQFDDVADGWIFDLGGQQQALAQREISVWQIGKRFEQNQVCDLQIQECWIELVWLEHGQIHLQIVSVAFGLFAHIILQRWQMLWVIPGMRKHGFLLENWEKISCCF